MSRMCAIPHFHCLFSLNLSEIVAWGLAEICRRVPQVAAPLLTLPERPSASYCVVGFILLNLLHSVVSIIIFHCLSLLIVCSFSIYSLYLHVAFGIL